MAKFKINIGKWEGYIADGSLIKPNSLRQSSQWTLTQTGTAPIAVVASTSTSTPNAYALDIQASTTGTDTAYFSHSAGTAPFFLFADNNKGYTIEAQIKLISAGSSQGQNFSFVDNIYQEYLTLLPTYAKLGNLGTTYPLTTTDDFHKYRITVEGSLINVYIDDILRISGVLNTTSTNSPYGASSISFGDTRGFADQGGRAQWAYFKYRTDGAFPSDEITSVGWVFDKIDINEKRRITETSIIRSNNSIVPIGKMQPASIKLSGTAVGTCWDSFNLILRRLKRMLNNGQQRIYLDNFKFIDALHKSFSFSPKSQQFADFSVDFSCRYPFFQEDWASYFFTAPVNNTTFYITNNGDVEVPLKVIITGAASGTINNSILLTNSTLSQQGKYIGVLAQTQEISIDKGFDIYNNYQILIGTAQSFGSYEGDLFTLQPGINAYVFTGGAVGTLEFYWREAFLI